jgi:hypothetical protein
MNTILKSVIVCGVIVGLLATLWKGIKISRQDAQNATCISHLKLIGTALMNYEHVHGVLPPAYVADNAGRRLHSWRVLILPYLGYESLYSQYKMDEPWNGPHNRRLTSAMPEVFQCPAGSTGAANRTNYVAVVGPAAAWRDGTPTKMSECGDASAQINTIMVVEITDSDIVWMEPRDIEFDDAVRGVNAGFVPGISSHHRRVANCLSMAYEAHSLDDTIAPAALKQLLTAGSGKGIYHDEQTISW